MGDTSVNLGKYITMNQYIGLKKPILFGKIWI